MAADYTFSPSDIYEMPEQTVELIDYKFLYPADKTVDLNEFSGGGPTRPASGFLYPRGDN